MKVNIIGELPAYFTDLQFGSGNFLADSVGIKVLFVPGLGRPTYYKGYLEDGGLNIDGERSCYHVAAQGNCQAVPTSRVKVSHEPYRLSVNPSVKEMRTRLSLRTSSWEWNHSFCTLVVHGDGFRGDFTAPDQLDKRYPMVWRNVKASFYSHNNIYTMICEYEMAYSAPSLVWFKEGYTSYLEIHPQKPLYRRKHNPTGTWSQWMSMTPLFVSPATRDYSSYMLPSNRAALENLIEKLDRRFKPLPSNSLVFGDLARRCANDAQVIQTNSIELVMELASLGQTLKSLIDLMHGKIDAKKIASSWLSYKYGLRLTAHDIKTVKEGIFRRVSEISKGKSRARARETLTGEQWLGRGGHLDVVYNYKIHYYKHSNDLRDPMRIWFDSGLFPSLTNVWDLIPFTFVADWFLGIEDYLNAIDANTYWNLYQITSVLYSRKKTFSDIGSILSNADWTFTGDMRVVLYERDINSWIHKPTLFDPSPRDFHNYAELAALFVVNKR